MSAAVVPLLASQTPDGAYRYLVDLDVGAPSQRIAVMLDTGSHYLMLRDSSQGACHPGHHSQACHLGHSVPQHRLCFNASASATFRDDEPKSESVEFSIDGLAIEATFDRAFDQMMLSGVDSTCGDAGQSSGPESSAASGTPLSLIGSTSSGGIGPVCRLPYFWADAAGVLGVSPRRRVDSPQWWESYITCFGYKFSLDLNGGTGAPSRLGLGVANRSWGVGAVQWASKQYELSFHRLELFDLSICGATLHGAVSNHWPALVDTGASCLALPAELHDALFAWVGVVNCTDSAPTDRYDAPLQGVGRRCWLPAGISPSTLPLLSFRLSQHAPQLQLPLEELLLSPLEDGSRELCVRVRASSSNHVPFQLPIIIGTKWLNHFVAHFEMLPGQRRVGFAPKQMPLTRAADAARRAASCARPAQCTGQQRYVAATNRCEPPQCTAFFVQLDEESGTCVYWTSFRVMLTAVLGAFSIAEVVLHQAQQRLPRFCSVPPDQHGPLLRFFMRVWARPPS